MKRLLLALVCLYSLPACQPTIGAPPAPPTIEVHFSPKGGCTEAVVKELSEAKSRILVQAYSFTSAPIAKALVQAHKRGVDVRVILDKGQRTAKYSSADFLHNRRKRDGKETEKRRKRDGKGTEKGRKRGHY